MVSLSNVGGQGVFSLKMDADPRWVFRGMCAHRRVFDGYVRNKPHEALVDQMSLRVWSEPMMLCFEMKKNFKTLCAANDREDAADLFGLVWAALRPGQADESAKYRVASSFVLGQSNVDEVQAACLRKCEDPAAVVARNQEVVAKAEPDLKQSELYGKAKTEAFGLLLYCYKSSKPTEGVMVFLLGHNGEAEPIWRSMCDLQEQVVQLSKQLALRPSVATPAAASGGAAAAAAAGAAGAGAGAGADAAAGDGDDGAPSGDERLAALEALVFRLEDKLKAADRKIIDLEDRVEVLEG